MMKLEEMVKLLGACNTKRWTIVAVTREQTVAEHQYRVWALAVSLYDSLMDGTPHNSFEREAVGRWALVHDADEIWTGDLPSPIKVILEGISPGILKKLKDRVLGEHLPTLAQEIRGIEGSLPATVVKVAECVEALTYYRSNSLASFHRDEVYKFLDAKLKEELATAVQKHPSVGWGYRGGEWVRDAMKLL